MRAGEGALAAGQPRYVTAITRLQSMRILIHDYAGHPFPVQLSRELARWGHTVTHAFASQLLTPRGELERRSDDPEGLSFRPVPMSPDYRKNKYSFIKRLGYERAYGRELVKLIEQLRPEVVLSGQTPSDPQMAFSTAAQRLGIPMVIWVQDFYSLAVDKLARKKLPFLGALAGAWYRSLDRRCFAASAGVVAITEDFAPVLAKFGVAPAKLTVIPNWASLEDMPLLPRINAWSVEQGLDGKFVYLYSGTLAMKHNPGLLLEVARRFRDDDSVRVVVISEGPGADFLSQAREREQLRYLRVLPFQDISRLPEVLASSDVVMAILETEAGVFSVPSKVLTYHAAGKPLLAAIPAGNLAARIIHRQASGLCVPPGDIQSFVAAAEDLRGKPSMCTTMAMNARAYAESEFDIKLIGNRFEQVLNRARGADIDQRSAVVEA